MEQIKRVSQIKKMHTGCWFSKGAMAFFGTRIEAQGKVFANRFFITSEQPPFGPRAYSIREYDAHSDKIDTVGDFMRYKSEDAAIDKVKELTQSYI